MKTKNCILTLCLLLTVFFAVAKEKGTSLISGQSLTELGQYNIQASNDAMQVGNEFLKTYELSYSNFDSPVQIGVKKTKMCMNFIVRTDNFEVEYVCNKHVFGVKRVGKEYQTVSTENINKLLNNEAFFHQRVISQNPKTEEELLGLIACYFPSLVKADQLAGL